MWISTTRKKLRKKLDTRAVSATGLYLGLKLLATKSPSEMTLLFTSFSPPFRSPTKTTYSQKAPCQSPAKASQVSVFEFLLSWLRAVRFHLCAAWWLLQIFLLLMLGSAGQRQVSQPLLPAGVGLPVHFQSNWHLGLENYNGDSGSEPNLGTSNKALTGLLSKRDHPGEHSNLPACRCWFWFPGFQKQRALLPVLSLLPICLLIWPGFAKLGQAG